MAWSGTPHPFLSGGWRPARPAGLPGATAVAVTAAGAASTKLASRRSGRAADPGRGRKRGSGEEDHARRVRRVRTDPAVRPQPEMPRVDPIDAGTWQDMREPLIQDRPSRRRVAQLRPAGGERGPDRLVHGLG
jgi:hypothetical protein